MLKKFENKDENQEQYAIIVNDISKSFNFSYERSYTLLESILNFIKRKKVSYNKLDVIKNIAFKVKKGEVIGIIGRNGAGKSTLLKLLTKIIYPDSGLIETYGKISAFLELGTGFNPDFNAEENIILYGTLLRLSKKDMISKMDKILEFAELKKFRYMKLRNFSSGMILRLAFATAINVNPDILIIDEVLAVGDLQFQEKCMNEMRKFKEEGKTIILVTHNLSLVKKFCDRVLLMDDGKIIASGDNEFVVNNYYAILSQENQLEITQKSKQKDKQKRWGTFEAEIKKIRLLDAEMKETYIITSGSATIVQLEIIFNIDIRKPIYGLVLRNIDGIYIYGTNTIWQRIDTKSYKKGDRIYVNFRQNLWLNQGSYTLTPLLSHEDGETYCDWQDDALIFKVEVEETFHGTFNLNSKIEIVQIE